MKEHRKGARPSTKDKHENRSDSLKEKKRHHESWKDRSNNNDKKQERKK